MRNRIGILLAIVALILGAWLFLEAGAVKTEEQTLRMQAVCDSLSEANHEHELHIMQLEHEISDLSDALSDCTEDFQNCLAGRKIEIRYQNGNILTSNPEY